MKLNFILIPLITLVVAVIGSMITSRNMDWYRHLQLPDFTPPGWIIGIVWTVLFILATISALIVWNGTTHQGIFTIIISIFIINAILNVGWTYIFFGQHILYLAIWEAITLCLSTIALAVLIWPYSSTASYLLWPYALWTGFASVLTISIWQLNR